MKYSPQLNVKSAYNFQESLITINDYLKFAQYHNFKFAFYNDINSMFGAAEFFDKFSKNNIKPIIGLTVKVEYENEAIFLHLYAKNKIGYKNLCYLSSELNTKNLTEVDKLATFTTYLDNNLFLVISFKEVLNQKFIDEFCTNYDLKNLYLGINQKNYQNFNYDNVIYTNPISYLNEEELEAYNVLLAIKNADKIDLKNHHKLIDEHYLLNADLVKREISEKNLQYLADNVDFDLFANNKPHLMEFKTENNQSQQELINELTTNNLNNYFKKNNLDPGLYHQYQARLNYELEVIESMNFINYFLIVWDYVNYAKKQNILVGPGRGSAASSLVSFLLGITEVDPLKYDLLFERFLNPERKTMPDIDIDFQDNKREKILEYLHDKYGENHVATIVSFQTIGAKNALRDVFRVFDKNVQTVNRITKLITNEFLMDLDGAINNSKLLQTYYENNQQAFEIAKKLIGLPRQTGTHAAGVILSDVDLRDVLPIRMGYNKINQTQFDMNYLEALGLIKMDLLGLRNLTMLQEMQHSVYQVTKQKIDFKKIPLNDEKVFQQLNEGKTTGIFQLESEGMTNLVMKMQVNSIEDISMASALFRPGPKDMIPTILKRKHSLKKASDYIKDKSLIKILNNTYGVILYQEQVIQVLEIVANFSLAKADIIRRAMSKKDFHKMESMKEEFLNSAIKNGYELKNAQQIWHMIEEFANYGFNKSHSIAYAYVAYWLAWFKYYYPEQFYAALFNVYFGNSVKTKQLINELKSYQISFTGPDIHNINANYVSFNKRIYAPLTIIKGIGPEFLKRIEPIYKQNQTMLKEFFSAMVMLIHAGLSKVNFEVLVWSGAFDRYGYERIDLIDNMDSIFNFAEVSSLNDKIDYERVPIIEKTKSVDKILIAEKEFENLGFYLSTNPFIKLREEQKQKVFSLDEIANKLATNSGISAVNLKKIRIKKDRNDKQMAFVTISDDTEVISATIFNDLYEQIKDQLVEDALIIANIKVETYQNQKRAIINRIYKWIE